MSDNPTAVITGTALISPLAIDSRRFCLDYPAIATPALAIGQQQFFEQVYRQKQYTLPEFSNAALPTRLKRRMSQTTRLLAMTALQCLQDADFPQQCHGDLALAIGTKWGESENITGLLSQIGLAGVAPEVSPTLFHNSVHNVAAGYLGIILQSAMPALTISQENYCFEAALECALVMLAANQAPAALAGAGDINLDLAVLDSPETPRADMPGSCFVLLETMLAVAARNGKSLARCSLGPGRRLDTGSATDYGRQLRSAIGPETITAVIINLVDAAAVDALARPLLAGLFNNSLPPVHIPQLTDSAGAGFLAALALLSRSPKVWNETALSADCFTVTVEPCPKRSCRLLVITIDPAGAMRSFLLEKPE